MTWRDRIAVHPAAREMPAMPADELRELGEDIKARGMRSPIVLLATGSKLELLDGCNRLDAMEMVGLPIYDASGKITVSTETIEGGRDFNARAYVLSLNVRRRHLTGQQRDEIVKTLIRENPEMSDRAIARRAGVTPRTVGRKRAQEIETNVTMSHKPDRVEASGRKARGRKPGTGRKQAAVATPAPLPPDTSSATAPPADLPLPNPKPRPDRPLGVRDPIETAAWAMRHALFDAMAKCPYDDWPHIINRFRENIDEVEKNFAQYHQKWEADHQWM